jgi:hypothetical protein
MSKKDKKHSQTCPKIPRAQNTPLETKTPRADALPSYDYPEFKVEQMDLDGPWGWKRFESHYIQDLMQRFFESQKITWQDTIKNGSHFVNISKLIPEAQKRLTQIKKDDLDELFSFRVSGKKRVWGIREGRLFWILWWDPNHEVCPSLKKNT